MYEAVRVSDDGATTPARFALTASRYGYDGIVLLGTEEGWNRQTLSTISEAFDIDVVAGIRLTPEGPASAGGRIASARPLVDVLCVAGATTSMARFIATQERVDVLSYPLTADDELPHTIAKTAREHGVYVELDLSPVLRSEGQRRSAAITALDRLVTIIDHYDVPYVVTASAGNHLEVRAWRELCALGDLVGLSPEAIETGLRAWEAIAMRSRKTRDDRFIEPGVRLSDHETYDR